MEKDLVFETAERYVNETGRSIFLTGKAGTGKTTFLKHITATTSKRFVVLAPTGVAAINAGGSTIHSFFLLPLCPYLPDVKELVTEYQMPEHYRGLRKDRIKIIRTLDLLIIDEISMVRADLLDAVDMTLRRYRRNDKPFGGVQLLMIGDAQQLSPVVKENERQYISQVYPSPYFFSSKALARLPYITIELTRVYRQKDASFLEILNAIRDNRVTPEILKALNSRVGAFDDDSGQDRSSGYRNGAATGETIRLTTHNAQADEVNNRKLSELKGKEHQFEAEIEGDFPESLYPVSKVLTLKKGAQVMFARNDPEGAWYNGKIGKVEDIDSQGIVSVRDSEGRLIEVEAVEWCNTQYTLDKESGEIRQDTVGTFRQLPLRIAWAITIHKSQGLTFDRVIINAGAAFAFGQVYVALSRCRSLEGISLETPVRASTIYTDWNVADFNAEIPSIDSVRNELAGDSLAWWFDILREIFSFEECCRNAGWVRKVCKDGFRKIFPDQYLSLEQASQELDQARKVGDTFRSQLTKIQNTSPQDSSYLNERLTKAAAYFLPVFVRARDIVLEISQKEVDNKETAKNLKESTTEALNCLETVCRTLNCILDYKLTPERYHEIKSEVLLEDRKKPKASRKLKKIEKAEGEDGTVNEELREKLQQWRTEKFKAANAPAYTIMHQSTLMAIASIIPHTKSELLSVKGFGQAKFDKYGEEILEICKGF